MSSSEAEEELDSFAFDADGSQMEEFAQAEVEGGIVQEDLDAKPTQKKKKSNRRAQKRTNRKGRKARRKRTVSDGDSEWDDDCPPQKTKAERSDDDFHYTIDEALREQRIDSMKAARLRECMLSGDWSEIAYSLLCEQIPLKRRGKGCYNCQVCLIPKKGHACPYCPVCSTPEVRIKKGEEHACINCPYCFEVGKKCKKLVQIPREGHVCPHEPASAKAPITEV